MVRLIFPSKWHRQAFRIEIQQNPEKPAQSKLFPPRTVHRANPREVIEDTLRTIEASTQPDWKAIEAQAKADLEAIQTDEQAYAFIQKYFSQDLQGNYFKIYRSDRREMNRTPRQAIDNLLSLPPIQ